MKSILFITLLCFIIGCTGSQQQIEKTPEAMKAEEGIILANSHIADLNRYIGASSLFSLVSDVDNITYKWKNREVTKEEFEKKNKLMKEWKEKLTSIRSELQNDLKLHLAKPKDVALKEKLNDTMIILAGYFIEVEKDLK